MEYIFISWAIIDKFINIFILVICVPSDDNVQTMQTVLSITYMFQVHTFSQNGPFRISYIHTNKLMNVATMRYLVQETLELHLLAYSEEHSANIGMWYYIVLQRVYRLVFWEDGNHLNAAALPSLRAHIWLIYDEVTQVQIHLTRTFPLWQNSTSE
jgi:hypothetical protein